MPSVTALNNLSIRFICRNHFQSTSISVYFNVPQSLTKCVYPEPPSQTIPLKTTQNISFIRFHYFCRIDVTHVPISYLRKLSASQRLSRSPQSSQQYNTTAECVIYIRNFKFRAVEKSLELSNNHNRSCSTRTVNDVNYT